MSPLNQWIDDEGKTPLIVACMKPNGLNVAKTLLELGANVNAYRPGMPLSANCDLIILNSSVEAVPEF